MKTSYLWLKEFVDFDQSPEDVARLLRGLGFDVTSVARAGAEVLNVVAARVESREKHPNADRLSLCKVFDGRDRWDVVCGAPNVAAGQTVPLARVGAKLPGGLTIEKAKIRGQESSGMLCSPRELGMGEDHSGILVLPEDTALGQDIAGVLDMGDAILDVEVTPNRPDALSHWGLAREIAAALGKKVRLPDMNIPKAETLSRLAAVEEPGLCPRYIGRAIEGVQVRPSPLRMRLRLERCGIRPISNLVDVTNYVLLELGHPLHVFDRDLLKEGRVTVRMGRAGETLPCLDGVTRPVEGTLVIADAERPAAVAGVMGGEPTAVRESTQNVLLESALFQPSGVRRARRRLNLSTESSYRFERGTDWDMAELAGRRAAHLILSLAGGRPAGESDVHAARPPAPRIRARPARIAAMLGFDATPAQIRSSWTALGFACEGEGDSWTVTPPVHRQDVREEADLAEETARLVGYDRIPERLRTAAQPPDPSSRTRRLAEDAGRFLTGQGFFEARNYGLASRAKWEKLAGAADGSSVEIENPVSLSGELLAPSLLVNLLDNLAANLRHGQERVRLFETARVFSRGKDGVEERDALAWIACGDDHAPHWKFKARPLEIWDAKAWVKALLLEWRVAGVRFDQSGLPSHLHPAEAQAVWAGDARVGSFGKLHPRRADECGAPRGAFAAELDLSALAGLSALPMEFRSLPKHPALFRDFSLIFPASVSWSAIALYTARLSPWVEGIELFDVFADPSLPAGHRSLAFRVTFRHPEKTLTDAEAAEVQEKVLSGLRSEFKAVPRG